MKPFFNTNPIKFSSDRTTDKKQITYHIQSHAIFLFVSAILFFGACLIELKILVENPLEMHYVTVEITDVNDNSPSFPEKQQTIEIGELTLPGKRFQLHAAQDPDAGINSIRTYTLTPNDYFEINIRQSDAGLIPFLVLKKSLDREQKTKHTFVVTVLDGGKPPKSGRLNISIIVLDINDNRPIFSKEMYELSIKENIQVGTSVFKMDAKDLDEGRNGEVEYSLGKTLSRRVYDIFELNKLTGEITVKGLVDYEEKDVYELDVEASDKGTPPLTGECRVIIKIIDINDNPPEIEITSLSNKVSEDSKPGTVISLISLVDKDSGLNGKVIPSIINEVPFELKPSYKENIYSVVTKSKSLDREKKDNHSLVVTAIDGGKPYRSGTLNISVIVLDINDNRPTFVQDMYQISIKENLPPGTVILFMNATDPDEGDNGKIEYSLAKTLRKNINVLFELDRLSGEIKVKGLLDFEENDVYKLDIEASDKGTPPLTGECRVTIKIIDVNDNPPEIEITSQSNTVSEDSKIGTVISLLSVTDKDSGVNGKIIASLVSNGPFELKPSYKENIYSVVTTGLLDREEVSHYEITIKATDRGEPNLSIENNIAGMSLFSVEATDNDVNANAAVSYHIARQNDVTTFLNINSDNGKITALKTTAFLLFIWVFVFCFESCTSHRCSL
uniref:Si:ch73-379j16.2 n=1 Tax=Kryptolebias marmoratus TaxID=37003 RepID=A0A3Q3FG31_KRYMA